MKKVIQMASLLIVIFITSTVWAGKIAEDSLDKLMALSGLKKTVAEIPGLLLAGTEQRQQGSPMPDELFGILQRSIESTFLPSEFLSTIGIEIKNNITELETKDLLAWYESDLGRRITKAEEKASTPVAYKEMIKEAQSLLADEKRVKIAKKIDSLLNATDMTMKLQENVEVAVFTALSTIKNPGPSVNIERFKDQVSAQEQQKRANIEQLVILSLVYSYRDLNMDSIEKYVNFLKRPITRKFNDSVIKGMMYAFHQSIVNAAKSAAIGFTKYDEKVNK